MAYLKPPAFTRHAVNPLVMRFNPGGAVTLTVIGRRSGEPRRVPVIPVLVDGIRYLVCPYGESEWVRNLRASGSCELRYGERTESLRASEVPVRERGPIIAAYRRAAIRAPGQPFTRLPDAKDHPVFRLAAAART